MKTLAETPQLPDVDDSWTLFLDRDGVINRRLPGAYVRDWAAFEWLPGVVEAIAIFSRIFGRVVVVTNQQGIGKGLMDEAALGQIHQRMLAEVAAGGGRIDRIYHCPDLATRQPNCRKPAPAMALKAKADFPEIDFQRSVMVGDAVSDMVFGGQLGMFKVLVAPVAEAAEVSLEAERAGAAADRVVESLAVLASAWDE